MERDVRESIPFICAIVQKPPKAVMDNTAGTNSVLGISHDFIKDNPDVISNDENNTLRYVHESGNNCNMNSFINENNII